MITQLQQSFTLDAENTRTTNDFDIVIREAFTNLCR